MIGGGQMHFTTSATLSTSSLHLHRSAASLSQSFSGFLQLVPSILSLVFLCVSLHGQLSILSFNCLSFPSTSCNIAFIKHLPQVILKHDRTTSYHLPFPAYLLLPSIPTCPSAPLYSSCPPTLHHTHHRSFCFSQNTLFTFKHHAWFP